MDTPPLPNTHDPVLEHRDFVTLCGRIFREANPIYFPTIQYRGRTIYLCTEACLHAMQADPEGFYRAHRKKTTGHHK